MKPLRIGVVGAGAVGGYFGGILARGGHAVTLIARPAQVEAIRSAGLRIESASWQATLSSPDLTVTTELSTLTQVDGVLLCVKSGDTEAVAAQIRPFLAPDCWVMSLQNGVDNASRASEVLGRAVIAAVVYVATAAPVEELLHVARGVWAFHDDDFFHALFARARWPCGHKRPENRRSGPAPGSGCGPVFEMQSSWGSPKDRAQQGVRTGINAGRWQFIPACKK